MRIGSIDLAGADALDAQLGALGTEVATKLGDDAVRSSARVLQQVWASEAPYRPGFRFKTWGRSDGSTGKNYYGHLRDNIKVRKVIAERINAIVYGVTTGKAFWAYFLERGTRKMAPHKWARAIVDRLKERLIRVQVDVLKAGIEGAANQVSAPSSGSSRRGGRSFGPVMPNGRNR